MAWLRSYKEDLDVMPDENGWCYVNHSRRKYLWGDYNADTVLRPEMYPDCSKEWFCEVWRHQFPELRLRKYHRFSKCDFCIEQRAIRGDRKVPLNTRLEAKARLKAHIEWAHKRERGLFKQKKFLAVAEPVNFISMSIDGTDQFPDGFPHFFEKTKRDDSLRLKLHVVCVIVHGSAPYIYLGWENILGDSNLISEVITRTLRHEEAKRGGLPPTFVLQMDNCWRENKNTYVEKLLEWYVERGVLLRIFASFLPVGHTHFDADQLASRIAEVMKHRDVKSVEELMEMLRDCFSPAPHVEFIDDVMDWKRLLNPEHPKEFPVKTARCRMMRGLCTKSFPKTNSAANYHMNECSPLHWRILKDAEGHTFFQSRHTVDDPRDQWSEPVYHWDTDAPRPHDRFHQKNESGLLVTDLEIAPVRILKERRANELRNALAGARPRLSDEEAAEFDKVYELLVNPPPVESPVSHARWTFHGEGKYDVTSENPPVMEVRLPANLVYRDQNDQNEARRQRREGVDASKLLIGNYVAYKVLYTDETKAEDRNDFWVGCIVQIDKKDGLVRIKTFHASQRKNLNTGSNRAQYKAWTGRGQHEWLPTDRLLLKFDGLTGKGRISMKTLRRIGNVLSAASAAEEANANGVI